MQVRKSGPGHLTRCLNLAELCSKLGHEIAFYLFSENTLFLEQISKRVLTPFFIK